jgi:hypothetical protein
MVCGNYQQQGSHQKVYNTVIPQYTSDRFTSFHLHEMRKLILAFQFMSQFLLIRAPSSYKPFVIPSGSNGKLILVLRVIVLRTVLEEWIKLVNRGITVDEMNGCHWLIKDEVSNAKSMWKALKRSKQFRHAEVDKEVFVCVCVRACERESVCVCVCVWERERDGMPIICKMINLWHWKLRAMLVPLLFVTKWPCAKTKS